MGVWKEWVRLSEISSAYVPFLSAFAVAITAGVNEEVTFRLFGISLGKKYLKNTALAILLTSCLWGIGHTTYAIFPVWFRGIEVTILGIIYGFIFVRYGLLPLIVAHYLFDAFFGVAGYLIGKTTLFLSAAASLILLIPLALALACYLANQKKEERSGVSSVLSRLNSVQKYNLEILVTFISKERSQGQTSEGIRKNLMAADWDVELIDLALSRVFGD